MKKGNFFSKLFFSLFSVLTFSVCSISFFSNPIISVKAADSLSYEEYPFNGKTFNSNTGNITASTDINALYVKSWEKNRWAEFAWMGQKPSESVSANDLICLDNMTFWFMQDVSLTASSSCLFGFYFYNNVNFPYNNSNSSTVPIFAFREEANQSTKYAYFNIVPNHDVLSHEGAPSLCYRDNTFDSSKKGLTSNGSNGYMTYENNGSLSLDQIIGLRFSFRRIGDAGTNIGKYEVKIYNGGGTGSIDGTNAYNFVTGCLTTYVQIPEYDSQHHVNMHFYSYSSSLSTRLRLQSVVYSENGRHVVFDANGGTTSSYKNIFARNGDYVDLPGTSRTGYTFNGWYTAKTGGTYIGTLGTNIKLEQNYDLYAQWTPNPYTVTYNANKPTTASGSVTNMPSNQSCTYDVNFTLGGAPSLTGHTFGGWYKEAACTSKVGDAGATGIKNLTSTKDATVTLYAKWTANTYTVNYSSNFTDTSLGKLEGSTASSTHTYDITSSLTQNGYSVTGHSFGGWNTKADGTGTNYANKASVTNLTTGGSTTLYAMWNKAQYSLNHTFADDSSDMVNENTFKWYASSSIEHFIDSYSGEDYVKIKEGAEPITSATWGDKVYYYYEANAGYYCKPDVVFKEDSRLESSYRCGFIDLTQATMDAFDKQHSRYLINHTEGQRSFSFEFEINPGVLFYSAESLAVTASTELKSTICFACDLKGLGTDLAKLGENWTTAANNYQAYRSWVKDWLNGNCVTTNVTINDYKSAYTYILTKYPVTTKDNDFMGLLNKSESLNNVFDAKEYKDISKLVIIIGSLAISGIIFGIFNKRKKQIEE